MTSNRMRKPCLVALLLDDIMELNVWLAFYAEYRSYVSLLANLDLYYHCSRCTPACEMQLSPEVLTSTPSLSVLHDLAIYTICTIQSTCVCLLLLWVTG